MKLKFWNALRHLVDALPKCRYCEKTATMLCRDATSDPVWTCDEHAFTGGIDGDEKPVELRTTEPLRKAVALLVTYEMPVSDDEEPWR